MADQHHECSSAGMSLAFLSGAIIGAVAAILYAPQSGAQMRTALRSYARRTEEEVLEKAREIRGELTRTIEDAKRYLKDTEATIEAALAAGKEAFKKERAERT
jgi:gas vesicle protein